jgi:hypothetical protein
MARTTSRDLDENRGQHVVSVSEATGVPSMALQSSGATTFDHATR